jgi:glycosyltransferase involved in cell wall biosynthesis
VAAHRSHARASTARSTPSWPTKFPTYFVRHPAKVAWLVHQHRAAYELCGTPFSDFEHTERDVGLRKRLLELDTEMLRECRGLFSIARTVSARLQKYNQLTATPLYHPPRLAASIRSGPYGDYLLTVSRLEKVKRIDLAIEAMARVRGSTKLVVAGDGSERAALAARVEARGLGDRVRLAGRVGDAELIELLAGARALLFTPFEEDYGYVTLEAFLARKPVVTTTDSGGPLEFVEDGVNGLVAAPTPDAVADAVVRLASDAAAAARLGDAGYARARLITWDGVVEQLLTAARTGAPLSADASDVLVVVPTYNERENLAAARPAPARHRRPAGADRGRRIARRHRHAGRRARDGERRTPHRDAPHRPTRAGALLRGRDAGGHAHRRALRVSDGCRPVA